MRSYVFLAFFGSLLPVTLVQPFVGALLWCWIAFMNPHREVWGFATNLPYAVAIFATTVFACVITREPRRIEANAVTVLLVVLGALVTLTSLTTLAPEAATWHKWDRTIKTIAGALLVACLLTSRRRIDALIWIMVISLGFYGVKGGVFTVLTGGSYIVLGPADTMIGDRNHLATALLVALPLMNYLRMRAAHAPVRVGLLAAMGLTLFSAVGSQSRGALVALGATAVLLWWRSQSKILSGTVIAACVAGVVTFMPPTWAERMETILSYEEDASAMGRVRIWQASYLLALDRPLVGAGFEGPYVQDVVDRVLPGVTARAVHSIYFEVLGEHGFPTFFAWTALVVAGGFYAWRLTKITRGLPALAWAYDFGRMAQVSMAAYLTGGAFLSLSYWDFYWILLVAVAATHTLVLHTLRDMSPTPAATRASGTRRSTSAVPALEAR
jgi:probable O-glycosylation ligase (exosortase A-associated)